jgi:PKHD-type hydroxylase
MILPIRGLLSAEELAAVREDLAQAEWADGKATAGYQSAQTKRNDQVREGDPFGARAGDRIAAALERNALFVSSALPLAIFPPLFNRYAGGQAFGNHVDNAIRRSARGRRLRTDLSATVFLSDPASYTGGELVIEEVGYANAVKLDAGDMVLYPARSIHRVGPVVAGIRLAAFFWVQSMVRDDGERALLFALDDAIRATRDAEPEMPSLVSLVNVYHNLLRRWAEC